MRDLRDAVRPVDELFELVADAQLVLLGEATHGTHEFYAIRAALTRRLISERGFRGVAVEADWPAAARANRFVQGTDGDAEAALGGFVRFPRWMWRNDLIVDLIEWLRAHGHGAGFYGLDLYSLRESMTAVVEYLDQIDPAAAARARRRYGCFDDLDELRERAAELAQRDGRLPPDAHFAARQNARLAAGAERYYRMMFRGRASTWNLRDTHMADTLDALSEHLGGAGIVVWAHN